MTEFDWLAKGFENGPTRLRGRGPVMLGSRSRVSFRRGLHPALLALDALAGLGAPVGFAVQSTDVADP
jgi:hypothetical protein